MNYMDNEKMLAALNQMLDVEKLQLSLLKICPTKQAADNAFESIRYAAETSWSRFNHVAEEYHRHLLSGGKVYTKEELASVVQFSERHKLSLREQLAKAFT